MREIANTQKSQAIQAVRGLAALSVVFLHLFTFTAIHGNKIAETLYFGSRYTLVFGVDVFFVVSGVIMARVLAKDHNAKRSVVFLFQRGVRIYPLYWVTLGCVLLLQLLGAYPGPLNAIDTRVETVFLLTPHPAHMVTWTLPFEIQFYLLIAATMLLRQARLIILGVWATLIVLFVLTSYAGLGLQVPFLFQPISLEFLMGVAVGLWGTKIRPYQPLAWAFLGILVAAIAGALLGQQVGNTTFLRVACFGPAAAIVVWAAISWEQSGGAIPKALVWLGDISYSTYMWHWPILMALGYMFGEATHQTRWLATFAILALSATILVSLISFRWIESPLNAWAKAIFRPTAGKTHGVLENG